jgi:hypothetical protein
MDTGMVLQVRAALPQLLDAVGAARRLQATDVVDLLERLRDPEACLGWSADVATRSDAR